jgi:hemerythrin-like domain-containing protein
MPAAPTADAERYFKELRGDHGRFGRVLALIGRHASALGERPDEAVLELLREAVDYIVNFQNRYHHPREDRMFDRMARKSAEHANALRVLRRDHEQSNRAGQELFAAIDRLRARPASGPARKALARELQTFALQMREHIRREDELMYSNARSILAAADWQAIVRSSPTPPDPLRGLSAAGTSSYAALAHYVAEGEPRAVITTNARHPLAHVIAFGAHATEQGLRFLRLGNRQAREAGQLALLTCMAAIRPQWPAEWYATVMQSVADQLSAADLWAREWRAQLGLDE